MVAAGYSHLPVSAGDDGDFDDAAHDVLGGYVGKGHNVAFLPQTLSDFPGEVIQFAKSQLPADPAFYKA